MLVNSPEITLARSSNHNTCFVQSLTENSSSYESRKVVLVHVQTLWAFEAMHCWFCRLVIMCASPIPTSIQNNALVNVSHTNSQCNAFHVPENFRKENKMSCFLEDRNKENQQNPLHSALQRMTITCLFFLSTNHTVLCGIGLSVFFNEFYKTKKKQQWLQLEWTQDYSVKKRGIETLDFGNFRGGLVT